MAQLLVLAGDGTERTFDLADAPVVCGRQEDNDIVLKEAKASRRHCTFKPWRGGWRVVDEGSSNGTFLGGQPVLSARLQPGDEIEIGDTIITFAAQASEMPKAATIRERRVRKAPTPWGVMAGAAALVAAGFVFAGSFRVSQEKAEVAAWKSAANAEVAKAALSRSDDEFRASLTTAIERMRAQSPAAGEAVKVMEAASARGLLTSRNDTGPVPEWKRALSKLDAGKARMATGERRWQLRELLIRNLGDKAAVATITESLAAEDKSARERAEADAARQKEDAEQKSKDGRFGPAIEAWQQWYAAAPHMTREEEKALAAALADLREQARKEADRAVELYGSHVKEGRLAAATAAVDGAIERLHGSGYDAWVAARTRRSAGPGEAGPGRPTAESDLERQAKIKEQRLQRALKSAEDLASKRKFADAAVLLREASGEITDPKLAQLKNDVDARIADLTAEADLVGALLEQVKAEPAHFSPLSQLGAGVKVAGATESELLIESKGQVNAIAVADLPGPAYGGLLEKAKLQPAQLVPAALLLHDLGESEGFVAWMRRALVVDAVRTEASAAYARVKGEKVPEGGYMPHPKDAKAIVTYTESRRIENEATIAAKTIEMRKVVDKIDATKAAKAVARVADQFAKLDAARDHALELIFDEVKYFYPYKTRMGEYSPVQLEVDRRVKAVREIWEDKVSEKIQMDSALKKLLDEAETLRVDIGFYGGSDEVMVLVERIERLKRYVGRTLTLKNWFVTEQDLALLEWNDQIMDYNAKLKGDVKDSEREQVRITNEYRKMMGHRRMLRIHDKLVAAARGHSHDMEIEGFFDHFSPIPGKREPGDRMKLAGYPNTPCSENIAMCGGSPQSAFDGWYKSSGHHRNMLMQSWSELGSGNSGGLWTQNFGFCTGDDAPGGTGPR